MSGIVFQELRESRALAYSVGAIYLQPSNLWDENLVIGDIATQPDKATEALTAFLDLFDNMPRSKGRFQNTLRSLENQYRVSKINFRGILGAVRGWERLGLEADPRQKRFEDVLTAEFPTLPGVSTEPHRGAPQADIDRGAAGPGQLGKYREARSGPGKLPWRIYFLD